MRIDHIEDAFYPADNFFFWAPSRDSVSLQFIFKFHAKFRGSGRTGERCAGAS